MKLIYIAGPFRAPNEWEVHRNIRLAEEAAAMVWKLGHAALCPHKNSEHFSGLCSDENFLEGDLKMLSACDAVLALPGFGKSAGTLGELARAAELGIPIFYASEYAVEFKNWLLTGRRY